MSKSVQPHLNLSFENWLIQDCHKTGNGPDCLFIYRNLPSIIIGRNQVNLRRLQESIFIFYF